MQITIDKGIPVAPCKVGRPQVYPFDRMSVGESFALPNIEDKRVRNAAYHYGRDHGLKFSTRKVEENGVKVVRCWRVA